LKATFPNKDEVLWPGQFVDVVLTLGEREGAIVAPAEAVQRGQNGEYVFVVKQDLTVESRPVTVSRSDSREAVIEKGLQAGETVVTDGQLRLQQGAKVQIKGEAGS
jgi:multidrug efflux system membrane fusion protein